MNGVATGAAGRRGLTPSVRILVAAAEGSVPREAGAVMWVHTDGIEGTIGGGALELEAIASARKMLADDLPTWHRELRAYPLGPALGQCCGGMVRLLYEYVDGTVGRNSTAYCAVATHGKDCGAGATAVDHGATVAQYAELLRPTPHSSALSVRPVVTGVAPTVVHDRKIAADWPVPVLRAVRQMLSGERPLSTILVRSKPDYVIEPEPTPPHLLYLYGAGHVGRAVVRALGPLPFAVTWVDVAAERFPASIEVNATPVISTDPAAIAAATPPEALHLIMTFSHAIDLSITHAVLANKFAWAGLIGSGTKRARFDKRLRAAGIADAALARLHCPIGIGGITGKEPAMIAISVAAQLAAWASAGVEAHTEKDSQHG